MPALDAVLKPGGKLVIPVGPTARLQQLVKVTRLADFIGKFPTVVFSSQDNQLLRGSPSLPPQ